MEGPEETSFLFEHNINFCRGKTTSVELLSPKHYSVRKSTKVVLIDSSGLSIERTLELWILQEYNVEVLLSQIPVIEATGDREVFS